MAAHSLVHKMYPNHSFNTDYEILNSNTLQFFDLANAFDTVNQNPLFLIRA